MIATTLAPIALFVYNRPLHVKKTLEALAQNAESKNSLLYIFCDGAKKNSSNEDIERIRQTRLIIKEQQWCEEIKIIESPVNKGLAGSIIDGVTQVINKHGAVIVLEDDLTVSPYFLKFMNDGLSFYKNDERVISLHGYVYPVHLEKQISQPTFLIKDTGSLGWATWKRAWDLFDPDGQKLLDKISSEHRINEFNFYGGYPFSRMLKQQIQGKNSSWAVRWRAVAFLHNKYTLHPLHSLVRHDGNDELATNHHTGYDYAYVDIYQQPVPVNDNVYCADGTIEKIFGKFLKKHGGLSIRSKIRHRVIKYLNKIKS